MWNSRFSAHLNGLILLPRLLGVAIMVYPLGCLRCVGCMPVDALAHGTLFGVALAALWQLPFLAIVFCFGQCYGGDWFAMARR